MAFHRSIRSRRGRKKITSAFELPLTSMMDILVIIVVFLLKSYSASTSSFSSVPGMSLPISTSRDIPPDSLVVIVTPEGITLENDRVLDFVQTPVEVGSSEAGYQLRQSDTDENGKRIIPLYDALIKARDKSELLRAKSKARDEHGNPLPFEGALAIQADKKIKYDTLRKVMYTSATAGYRVFRFLAVQREM